MDILDTACCIPRVIQTSVNSDLSSEPFFGAVLQKIVNGKSIPSKGDDERTNEPLASAPQYFHVAETHLIHLPHLFLPRINVASWLHRYQI